MTVTQACVVKYAFFKAQMDMFRLDQIQSETTKEFRFVRKNLKSESHMRPKLLKKPVSHERLCATMST